MATTASPNNFNLTGFVAVSATIRSFENSSVARFPLSISRRETAADGSETRKSALISCECWSKTADSARFALLQKGTLVSISGYLRPDEYTDREGNRQQRVVFVATSVARPSRKEEASEPKAQKAKAKKEKAA